MADDYYSSANLITFNESDLSFDVSDVLNDAPVLSALSAFSVDGTVLKYVKKSADPVVGFRALNAGVDNDVATYTQVSVDLAIADASFNIDIAAAEGYRLGPAAFIALQMQNHMQAMMAKIENELINGGASDGFASLSEELDSASDAMVVDAGGTESDKASSAYLIRSGMNDVQVCWGNQGVIEAKDTTIVRSAAASGTFPSYYTAVTGYVGLTYGSAYSAGRIVNLTNDSGKGLTDDLIADALSKFPAGRGPNMIAVNRRSLKQLQNSRTATNATGAPAPFPESAFGVPIIVTDQISSTEAIVS